MLSLSNSYSKEEILDFEKRIQKLTEKDIEYTCELKYDGVAISLTYENGVLLRGVTRGDGEKGEDVTANVRTVKSIPLKLRGSYPDYFEIRGEIVFPHKAFQELNMQREKDGYPRIWAFRFATLDVFESIECQLKSIESKRGSAGI